MIDLITYLIKSIIIVTDFNIRLTKSNIYLIKLNIYLT